MRNSGLSNLISLQWLTKTIVFPLAFSLLSVLTLAQNQTAKITGDNGIQYWEYLPPDYNSNSDKYPIVIFLHGLGERGTNINQVLQNGPPRLVKDGHKFPFILVSPQLKPNYGSWLPKYVDNIIEHCKKTLRVDPSRIYLTGLSLGGGGVWSYAQDPVLVNKLAAIAPICGHQNSTAKACTLAAKNLPVWAFHGDNDNTVPYGKTVSMVNAINACVPAPSPLAIKTIYPGVDHNSWDRAYRTDNSLHTPNLYQWLLQFRNNGLTVNAGNDITLNLPTNATSITGTASISSGTITSYAWTKVNGPAAVITNASSATVSLSALTQGTYVFRLTVTTSTSETSYDEVTVTVLQTNQSPVANAGADISITLPTNTVTITGSGSDPDGSIATYAWNKISGPSTGNTAGTATAALSLSNLVEGAYVFSLTVTDNAGATSTDMVTITVNPAIVNQNPVANAGSDLTLNLPTNSTNVTGAGSDGDGSISAYLWEKVSGPTATLANDLSATLSLSYLLSGVYVFRLTVTDNAGATATDEMTITVVAANQSPVANAGADISITLPINSTTITGSGSDADGSITNYTWTNTSGPNTPTLVNANTATLTANDLVEGSYTFRLTITDDKSSTAFDDVTVTVHAAAVNMPPTAQAGGDQTVNLPTNSTNLNGGGSDTDGSIASYEWIKISGPSATLTNNTTATLSLSDLVAGIYQFRLTVTDNQGATATDDATITVVAANQSPIANAAADITITLPTNTTNINGSGSDPDGTVTAYAWTQVNGPTTATLVNATSAIFTVNNLAEGLYTFRLTVTDDQASTAFDDVTVTVNAAAINVPPTAYAGVDLNITLPTNSVLITGTGTDTDGTITAYEWTKVSGPTATLTNDNTATMTADALVAGKYVFRLTVTDNQGGKGTDNVTVIVQSADVNQSPVANAGSDISLTLPANSTTLNGSGVDPDGSIVSYAWIKTSGPAATLSGEATATLQLTDLIEGIYAFELTVTDDKGDIDTDNVIITVNAGNQAPTANAGSDIILNLPVDATTITGVGNDTDGTIATHEWIQISGPNTATLTDQNTNTVSVAALIAGTYTFRLTVTDDDGASATDEVKVIVNAANLSPTAQAGTNKTITLPTNSVTFNGTATDADGTVSTFNWIQIAGPGTATLTNDNTRNLSVTVPQAGTYTFRFTVTDNGGASDYDDVDLIVNPQIVNQPPVANAGPNVSTTLPVNAITISGAGSDPDGSIVTYKWIKSKGPTATLSNGSTPTLSVNNLLQGTYIFRLTVTDDKGLTAFDEVTVTVFPAAVNQIPVANAGANKIITLPTNSTTLAGSGSDADGSISTYNWTQLNGPSVSLTNANTANLILSSLVEGVYNFRLTVTDDKGAIDTDDVTVTVNAAVVNQAPVANAGTNKTITLPINTLNITGLGSDADGSITSYAWVKVSGPAVTLSNTNTVTVSLANLIEGDYIFRLTVTDNGGLSHADDVVVKVLAATINQAPVANAGINNTITLPLNSITLFGSASDADGSIASYQWIKVSGPTATLSNDATPNLSVSGMVEGVYVFRLTVSDDDGATSSDEVQITVNATTTNQLPIANAGADFTITLPTSMANLSGAGSDADGSIAKYTWAKVSGPTATLTVTNLPTISITDLVEGTYVFRLQVEDDKGAKHTDDVTLTVLPQSTNQAPVVNAGADKTIIEPESSLTITGIVNDNDGNVINTTWTQVSGATAVLTNTNSLALQISNLAIGSYRFRLTATDDKSATSFDEVSVVVKSAGENQAPFANAGEDVILKLPENQLSITGSGNDPDGTIASYSWIKLSGPSLTITGETTATIELTNLAEGVYEFALTVTDDEGETNTDNVKITVLPATFNQSPVANAGPDVLVELPDNSTTLKGTVKDDGTITEILWAKTAGPAVTLSNINTTTLTLSDLVEGEYVFSLTITDDGGLTDTDEVVVTVLPETPVAEPPLVSAGSDLLIQLPDNTLTIAAIAESPEGLIASYKWAQVEGSTLTITPDTTAVLTLINLIPGDYAFTITVKDNFGLTATDDVRIRVLEEEPTVRPRNLFSPDNKGDINSETWTIENAPLLDGCEIKVYNRQGQKVYSSIGYPIPWDGTYNGSPVPDGAYFYVIGCAGQKSQTGSVTITRLK